MHKCKCDAHAQAVKLMSSEKAHHFRGEEHFQIWIKDYKGKQILFCGLTCMNESFTTKIAMCPNKINIVIFYFTRTLRLRKGKCAKYI